MATLTLESSARVRYATGAMMYFAQGIPQGLLAVTVPAWLAAEGLGAGAIGTYLAIIVLPWAFKLVSGPPMDRFMYLPMGRRRLWVLGAQLGLALALLGLMVIEDPARQLNTLIAIGLLVNVFAATQDVAVDGMCIDLTPVREQGRLNAFMSFGKAAGWGSTAAASGILLERFGMQVTAIAAAVVAGLVFLAFIPILERAGERRLPWSRGEARTTTGETGSFRKLFGGLSTVLWTRASIVVLLIMFFDGVVTGYGQALMPVAAVDIFGYTTAQWSQLVAVMGLIGAVVALGMGPAIDRWGSKRMLLLNLCLIGVYALVLAQTQVLWENTLYVRAMLSFWVMMMPVVMVCGIALAMAMCSSSASATQFAVYMSVGNFGYSAGSKLFGMAAEQVEYVEIYTVLSVLVLVTVLTILFHRYGHAQEEEEKADRTGGTYTISTGGAEAGLFFSGAIRCPKCRADMEQVTFEDVEIDRCVHCAGIWFDAGEAELLRSKEAASAIDTGEASTGRRLNRLDEYRCPRCGGEMEKHVDPQQRHIWFESCLECRGSFFDAGEFRDAAQLTVGDFVKRWFTPGRGT